MANKSPREYHTQWPNVASPSQLPNVSGATIQDSALEVGDICYSISDSMLYFCTTATAGSAVWAQAKFDSDAIHDNVLAEINAVAEKTIPVDDDILLAEDSASGPWTKKKVKLSSLLSKAREVLAASNESVTMGGAATEIVIGKLTYDGSKRTSHTFKAIVEPSAAVTCELRLYDKGPVAGPPVAENLCSKLTTSLAGLQVLSLTLTATGSPTFPDNDEIYNSDRMYELRAYISGTAGDVFYVGKVSLEGA